MYDFFKGIRVKWNAKSLVKDLNSGPMTIAVTLRALRNEVVVVWTVSILSWISNSPRFVSSLAGVVMKRVQLLLLLLLLLLLFSPLGFFTSELMVFHWSLSDSKSPQVSRTRLRILAVLSNAIIWIVSTRPPTSKSSRPFNNPLLIVLKVPITIGTFVTFMFHSFFNSLGRSRYLSFFSHSFIFILWSAGTAKLFFLLRVFYCSVSWWFLSGVWVTANLPKSPGIFSVVWYISTILCFR